MVERFGLNKKELNRIKKLAIPQQIAEINSMLDGMGVTQEAITKMGSTTLGMWSQIGERTEKFMRSIGDMGNSKIGEVLGDILNKFESLDLDAIAGKIDAVIGGAIVKVVDFAKKAWEVREPFLAVAKVIGTFVGVVAGIVAVIGAFSAIGAAVGFLTSPIGLLALAIIGISKAFKVAYEKSEPFRKAVDGIVGGVKTLYKLLTSKKPDAIGTMLDVDMGEVSKITAFANVIKGAFGRIKDAVAAFKTGDTSGVLAALGFSPEAVAGIMAFVTNVKTKVGEFVTYLKSKWAELQPSIMMLVERFVSMKDTAISVFAALWGYVQPVLGAIGVALGVVADIAVMAFTNIIAPAIDFLISMFQTAWIVIGPLLGLIGDAIGVAFDVLKIAWNTILKPVAEFLLGTFKTAFEDAKVHIDNIAGAFGTFADKIGGAVEWVSKIKDAVANFKVPNWLSRLGGGGTVKFESNETTDGGKGKSNYHGIDYVPYDGYQARLHKGERVQTAQEVREGGQGGGSFQFGDIHLHGVAGDLEGAADRLMDIMTRKIESEAGQMS